SDQGLFGLANIRPAFEERGRHARRHFGRKRLLNERQSAWHVLRVVAKENADGIFFLRDLPLEVRDSCIGRIENLLSLQDVELCCDAMLHAKIRELHRVYLRIDSFFCDSELKVKL